MMQHIGTPGASLSGLDAPEAKSRVRVGARGEHDTKRLLDQMFRSDSDVWAFHDLRVPGGKGKKGESANIDHVLMRGRNVVVLDSKRWSPGVYFTLAGHSFRAPLHRAPWCDKATVGLAADRLRERLPADVTVVGAIMVHPSRAGSVYLRLLRSRHGVATFPADSLQAERWLRKALGPEAPPDANVGKLLRSLVIGGVKV